MSSVALQVWQTDRKGRIEELQAAHAAVGGTGRGRRVATEQLNRALATQLASEFQGFARDLHDEAATVIVNVTSAGNPALGSIVQLGLTLNRQLDRGNAHSGSLGSDFKRLGMDFWPTIGAAYKRKDHWIKALDALNSARNGIAHSDDAQIQKAVDAGYPIRLQSMRRWRTTLNTLASAMDIVISIHLSTFMNGIKPW